jgi:hypothetical protein
METVILRYFGNSSVRDYTKDVKELYYYFYHGTCDQISISGNQLFLKNVENDEVSRHC